MTMATNDNDLTATTKEMWSNLSDLADVVATVYEEEQRARKGKAKIVYEEENEESKEKILFMKAPKKFATRRYRNFENLNGASSSRLRLRGSEPLVYDEEQRAKKQKSSIVSEQYDDEPSKKKILFDLVPRKIRSCPKKQSSSHLRIRWSEPCSSPLLLHHNTESKKTETKTPPNPKSQSSPSWCLKESKKCKNRTASHRSGGLKTGPYSRTARVMPWWLVPVVRGMNGEQPMLIFVKTLFGTDVNPSQSRFLMPFNRLIRNDFLTAVELRILNADIDNGVGAILVDPRSVKWGVFLKKWGLKNDSGTGSWTFSLTCGWNEVVEANDLKDGDNIGVWTFRCRGVLCFALVPLPPARGRSKPSFLL